MGQQRIVEEERGAISPTFLVLSEKHSRKKETFSTKPFFSSQYYVLLCIFTFSAILIYAERNGAKHFIWLLL